MEQLDQLSESVQAAISRQDVATALSLLQTLAQTQSQLRAVYANNRMLDRLVEVAGTNVRHITVLRNYTFEQIVPLMRQVLVAHGLIADIQIGDFNQFEQQIWASETDIYSKDVVIFAATLPELAPELVLRRLSLLPSEVDSTIEEIAQRIEGWVTSLRAKSNAKILVQNFAAPRYLPLSILDRQSSWGLTGVIERLNREVARICRDSTDTFLVDLARVQLNVGLDAIEDRRLYYLARQPFSQPGLCAVAHHYARMICAMFLPRRKVVVVDLDETLWGGVLGEEGARGIHLGPDYPGNVYMDFQRALLNLFDRGILLAINSKNNQSEVMHVLETHPHMILRPKHFAVIRANWQPKPENMLEIAVELNLGLDSLVFLDDSPHECALVRSTMPDVLTVNLDADPLTLVDTLDRVWELDTLTYSDEDRKRGMDYAMQLQRKELQAASTNLEEFYRSLKMQVKIVRASDETIPRISQLTLKTNQFNLTTKRYSETDIRALTEDPEIELYSLFVQDRFGDGGNVGVGILKLDGAEAYIDTFLLSCRVLGRHLENVLLHHLAARAKTRGATVLIGEYRPTAKNEQVRNFFPNFGFRLCSETQSRIVWESQLSELAILIPEWITFSPPEMELPV